MTAPTAIRRHDVESPIPLAPPPYRHFKMRHYRQPSLLALDVERAYDFPPAGHFTGHIAGESHRVRVERLGGIVFGELAHLRFFEKRTRLAIDAGRDVGRKLLRARQAEP